MPRYLMNSMDQYLKIIHDNQHYQDAIKVKFISNPFKFSSLEN